MPLGVDPSKPRLLCDCHYYILWMRSDLTVTMLGLRAVPSLLAPGAFMTTIDHRCGYLPMKRVRNG